MDTETIENLKKYKVCPMCGNDLEDRLMQGVPGTEREGFDSTDRGLVCQLEECGYWVYFQEEPAEAGAAE